MTEDPQQIWTDYYARIRQRRIAQAKALHEQMSADGVTDETLLTIDFLHFGNDEADVEDLAEQLSENYTMTVIERPEKDYWNAEGTIYPCAVDGISPERGIAWVEFMCPPSGKAYDHRCWPFSLQPMRPSRNPLLPPQATFGGCEECSTHR